MNKSDDIPSILDNDETYNISEMENSVPFYELSAYVREFLPQYIPLMDNFLRNKDVNAKDFQKILRELSAKLVPLYDHDGRIDDHKMERLHKTLSEVGKQL